MKKTIAWLLLIAMLITSLPSALAEDTADAAAEETAAEEIAAADMDAEEAGEESEADASAASGEEKQTYEGTAAIAFNMRETPDTGARHRGNVPEGHTLRIDEYHSDWCLVTYRNHSGYAKRSWLNIPGAPDEAEPVQVAPTPAPVVPGKDNSNLPPVADVRKEVSKDPAESNAVDPFYDRSYLPESVDISTAAASVPTEKSVVWPTVGSDDDNEVRYAARTLKVTAVRKAPDSKSPAILTLKKHEDLYVISYGTEWCKVMTAGRKQQIGWAKSQYIYSYHSMDPFQYPIPGWEDYEMTGYVVLKEDYHIDDLVSKSYTGNDLHAGNILFVQLRPDGTVWAQVRRTWAEIPAEICTYYPITNWREAKKGDIIGGYTQYFGQHQGGAFYRSRKNNIARAMKFMADTIIPSGTEYKFYNNIGPVKKGNGYETAGITGGAGTGVGGGVCHTSTLMYESILSLPFYVTDRRPHTDDGATYAPLEFDATVGVYSDMSYVNTLPYDIKMHAYMDRTAGVITVSYECLETVDPAKLADWNLDSHGYTYMFE
ncbi:MAG: VanW family protein [Clostridia bacterium]|nr:VanW family protein [Clostridia bacterium]